MPTLLDYVFNRNLKSKLPEMAHFSDKQWVHQQLSWKEGVAALKSLFPRDTRPEKPKEWYRLLEDTHWPGKVPPGNGPFFVPDWALAAESYEDAKRARDILKGAGFKEIDIPTAILPPSSEYLHVAMRVAGKSRWTANPTLYQVYWYPQGSSKNIALRSYTSERWTFSRKKRGNSG